MSAPNISGAVLFNMASTRGDGYALLQACHLMMTTEYFSVRAHL